jgi:glycosyltransferase involved in cell wall biosynthesis
MVQEVENKIYLSVIIPLYNEEENIPKLVRELDDSFKNFDKKFEIIIIDDGSCDKSFQLLSQAAQKRKYIRIIRFGINFGQTAAISAGFHAARGEIIITMDADLQNDPRDVPLLLKKMEEGYDIVSGWRKNRKDKFLTRRLPSIIANKLISWITNVALHDYGCTLKAYRREIVNHIDLYGEMHRFIPALGRWCGASIAEVEVNHRERKHGKSKYGLSRTFRVLLDLLTVKFFLSYSTRPIQIFGKFGLYSFLIGLASLIEVIVLKVMRDRDMTGNPFLYLSVLMVIIGVQFIILGLLGEIIIRTYYESQKKTTYIIKERIN